MNLVEVCAVIDLEDQSKGDIDRQLRLSLIHKVIGAELCGGLSCTVVRVDQSSYTALPVGLVLWMQLSQHINEGGIESFTLVICLGMVWTGSEFLCPH